MQKFSLAVKHSVILILFDIFIGLLIYDDDGSAIGLQGIGQKNIKSISLFFKYISSYNKQNLYKYFSEKLDQSRLCCALRKCHSKKKLKLGLLDATNIPLPA